MEKSIVELEKEIEKLSEENAKIEEKNKKKETEMREAAKNRKEEEPEVIITNVNIKPFNVSHKLNLIPEEGAQILIIDS